MNGNQNTADSDNSVLKSSVQDKLKIFQMFDINLKDIQQKLPELFAPITELIKLIDNNFNGYVKRESELDFLLRHLFHITQV